EADENATVYRKEDRQRQPCERKSNADFAQMVKEAGMAGCDRDLVLHPVELPFPAGDGNTVERAEGSESNKRNCESGGGWQLRQQRHRRSRGEQNADGQFLGGQRTPDQTEGMIRDEI